MQPEITVLSTSGSWMRWRSGSPTETTRSQAWLSPVVIGQLYSDNQMFFIDTLFLVFNHFIYKQFNVSFFILRNLNYCSYILPLKTWLGCLAKFYKLQQYRRNRIPVFTLSISTQTILNPLWNASRYKGKSLGQNALSLSHIHGIFHLLLRQSLCL